ncbi:DNA glycosylase AlkZ-like family protein [Streptomyces nigrescens]|uniref:Winged helix DNA-binding domain-containing protein n=1 Tax=Streptomyces nigrescens TaxID=1920 RepID=A0ABY7J5C3_STRNI|nr:crosslink repair DNA glycosylase YcaQ family protein [Streptomyces nigrescens]WAU05442.1 winged helix DNA-binding domain-containing protein [Streptomyces nigrescens]
MKVTHAQVAPWRLRQQSLVPRTDAPVEELVARLAGVQAQVGSAAELTLAVRQKTPRAGAVPSALAARALVRTWAMRGTLHLLPAEGMAAYLALLGAARTWEKPSWQRALGHMGRRRPPRSTPGCCAGRPVRPCCAAGSRRSATG